MINESLENNKALVTVLMSVYIADTRLLDRAVKSILNQTYRNIEFIIVDDGADKNCLEYLDAISDSRVVIIHNETNMGLAASLNKGIEAANGEYIARMDSDDYSLPERISEQVRYMNEHSDVDVLACIAMDIQGDKLTGGIGGAYAHFDNDDMRIELSIGPKTFPHPAVMFRKSFLTENSIRYDESFKRAQDYDMWARCSLYGKLDSLQKVLLFYNIEEGRNNDTSEQQLYYSDLAKLKCLERLIPDATDREKDLYVHMKDMEMTGSVGDNLSFVNKLIEMNNEKKVYDPGKYEEILYFWWGRKMLYPENRGYFSEFISYKGFAAKAFCVLLRRMPGHLYQQLYLKRTVRRYIKNLKPDWNS